MKLFDALMAIPPSSIESERTYSVTRFYTQKFRCSLRDQSINALVFLKHTIIFQKEEQEEKDRIEKERLKKREKKILLNHFAKTFC